MSFEIHEVEEEEPITTYVLSYLLYPHLHVGEALAKVNQEKEKREKHEEFWSDPCWSEL